ncbi:MAG: DUF2141 domain-containing protein [Ekhidna sp.]|nr:DUF2141 domain-containing protein [Ekhidna sp.]
MITKRLLTTIFTLFLCSFLNGHVTEEYKLFIKVVGLKDTTGKSIKAGIYSVDNRFPEQGSHFMEVSKSGDEESIVLNFDLPRGEYAVAIFHDLDGDGMLNTNWIGIPREPYGFSKNFHPKMSAPSFDDCSFKLTSDKTIEISLID